MIPTRKVADDLDDAERRERLLAMRHARYRANLGSVVTNVRPLALTAALVVGVAGWPFPVAHVVHLIAVGLGHPSR